LSHGSQRPDQLPDGAPVGTGTGAFRRPFVPEVFGKYYLLDRIAVGGMAEVFRAKTFGASGFEKVLVIKRILGQYAEDPEFVDMFIDEAKLSVQLVHPNIAQLYDFGKLGSNYFIAMEAVDGKDLKTVLKRLAAAEERMPVAYAAYFGHQLARGLDYAHKRSDSMGLPLNIVHRDVSPSNVIVSYEGHVKIVDFGIAHAESANRESESGVLKGKYSYMSPEQASGYLVDHRSDIFSAGICLWEMLTGNRLFRYGTEIETLEAIKQCHVPPPSQFNPEVPRALDEVCLIAMARDPADRFQEAAAMQDALTEYLLPSTPDRLAPSIATFVRERFGEEIRQEWERLDRGTQLAADLHYGGEVDLDLDLDMDDDDDIGLDTEDDDDGAAALPVSTETVKPVAGPAPANRLVIAALGVIGALVVALGLLVWPLLFPEVEVSKLQVTVLPTDITDVTMTVDGVAAPSTHVEVAPDVPHEVVITAPGYKPRTKQFELVAGQTFSVEVQLEPELGELEPETANPLDEPLPDVAPAEVERATPAPRRTPAPQPVVVDAPPDLPPPTEEVAEAAEPSIIFFASRPATAQVLVDGRSIGTTPLEWTEAEPGVSYRVELRKSGHDVVRATVTGPDAGRTVRLSRELPSQVADEPGKLNVQATPGWAKVYIDGAYVGTTPLIGHELPPGSYTIRLENERLGADISDVISVSAGQTTIKAYQLDQ